MLYRYFIQRIQIRPKHQDPAGSGYERFIHTIFTNNEKMKDIEENEVDEERERRISCLEPWFFITWLNDSLCARAYKNSTSDKKTGPFPGL